MYARLFCYFVEELLLQTFLSICLVFLHLVLVYDVRNDAVFSIILKKFFLWETLEISLEQATYSCGTG